MNKQWVFTRICSATHVDKRYGFYFGRERFGAMGEHYGYPSYRFGIYFCWGHNTWFIGLSNERKSG